MPPGGQRTPLTDLVASVSGYQQRVVFGGGGVFSPGTPINPVSKEPIRLLDFRVGENTFWTPRGGEAWSFQQLRNLVEPGGFDLARLAIETRKDQIERLDWIVRPIEAGKRKVTDARVDALTKLIRRPDGIRDFATWTRRQLEDLFVIDAPAAEVRRNRGGEIIGFDVVDGATFKLLIDDTGRTPQPPAPAYEQIIKGRPWTLLTTDELIYTPRNQRPSKIYGFSPIEQVLTTLHIGLSRQLSKLNYFCYYDDMEVLTKRGWFRFADTNESDEFATRQIGTGVFEWQKAVSRFYKHYSGPMIRFENRSLDLLVTPHHRMLVDTLPRRLGIKRPRHKTEHVILAEDLAATKTNNIGIPQTSVWRGVELENVEFFGSHPNARDVRISGDDYCAFMGMYLADGNLHGKDCVQISQPKGDRRGVHEIYRELLDRLFGRVSFSGHQFEFGRVALADHLRQFGKAADKFVPQAILDAPPRQLAIFWRYYVLGDGCARGDLKGGAQQVITVSRRLADHLTEVIQKLGFASTVWTRPAGTAECEGRTIRAREAYVITLGKRRATKGWRTTTEHYDGPVACVSVPNTFLYVRRNGKAAWCGNTDGTVPAGFLNAPDGWSPDQVREYADYLQAVLAGNLDARRRVWVAPNGARWQPVKESPLKDEFDEWVARVVCYAFSLPPTPFIRQLNRSTSQTAGDTALEEGLEPIKSYLKRWWDEVIQRRMGYEDLEFAWLDNKTIDPAKQADIDDKGLRNATFCINDILDRHGIEPVPNGNRRMIYTPSGAVLLDDIVKGEMPPKDAAIEPDPGAPDTTEGSEDDAASAPSDGEGGDSPPSDKP